MAYESFVQMKKEEIENKIKSDFYNNFYSFQQDLTAFNDFFEVCTQKTPFKFIFTFFDFLLNLLL